MINANMRLYDFYTYGEPNEYGQKQISTEKKGSVKMAITISSQTVQDNILYQGCQFMGLTHDTEIKDDYVIEYGKERLKVLYVSPQGRLRQVFMQKVE